MRHRSARLVRPLAASLFNAALFAIAFAGNTAAAPIWDQSDVGTDSITISYYYIANDFTVATKTSLTRATVWMVDAPPDASNGVLDHLNATFGWAVYQDASGSPGALVGSGVVASRVSTDTGLDQFGFDVFQVRFETVPPVILEPGTYWFALHDGEWGSGNDETNVLWAKSATIAGTGSYFAETFNVENPPTTWSLQDPGVDPAFTLEGPTFLWDQSAYDGTDDGLDLNTFAGADDFTLAAGASFSAIDAWIEDFVGEDTGTVDGFEGQLGWAVFANGKNDLPAERLASGQATAAWIEDLEAQSVEDTDTARVHLPLGQSVTLEPGTYWLGLHEGDWPGKPTSASIRWGGTSAPAGFTSAISDPDADAFEDGFGLPDYAFQLYEEPLFSSGFEAGTTCTWQPPSTDCP